MGGLIARGPITLKTQAMRSCWRHSRSLPAAGPCASEDTGFCCARGSRYRNPPGGDHFERNGLRPALLTAQSY